MTTFISLRTALNGGLLLIPVDQIRIVASVIDASNWFAPEADIPSTAQAFVQSNAAGNACVLQLWVRESVEQIAEKLTATPKPASRYSTPLNYEN